MKLKIHRLIFIVATACCTLEAKEGVVSVGNIVLNGKTYETKVSSSSLYTGSDPFPVSFIEAENLVMKELVKNPHIAKKHKIASITLLNFEEGKIIQIILAENLLKFAGGVAGPTVYYYVSHSKEIISPEVK